jgi:hypothetical protein
MPTLALLTWSRSADLPFVRANAILALALLLSLGRSASAQPKPHSASTPAPLNTMGTVDERKLQLDRERLDFDKQKFMTETAIAREKLQNDRDHETWSALSTLLPFFAGFLTLGYSVWSFRKQATTTARLQNETARLQFEMKAAEIAFAGKTPTAVQNRAGVLKTMFGDRLPGAFPPPFDVAKHGEKAESPAEKIQFLEMLLKYPDHQQQAVDLWAALFTDDWLDRVKPVVIQPPATAPAPAPVPASAPAPPNPANQGP